MINVQLITWFIVHLALDGSCLFLLTVVFHFLIIEENKGETIRLNEFL